MNMNLNVNFDVIGERTLRNTSRLVNQGMWILFIIAAGLMLVLRRSAGGRTGSLWFLGLGVLAFMASVVLRDIVKKAGHRHTENRIVSDVKSFLEREPAADTTPRPVVSRLTPVDSVDLAEAGPMPSQHAGFVPLRGAAPYRTPDAEPVVFDAIPARECAPRTDFYAVLMPVRQAA